MISNCVCYFSFFSYEMHCNCTFPTQFYVYFKYCCQKNKTPKASPILVPFFYIFIYHVFANRFSIAVWLKICNNMNIKKKRNLNIKKKCWSIQWVHKQHIKSINKIKIKMFATLNNEKKNSIHNINIYTKKSNNMYGFIISLFSSLSIK